MSEDDTHIDDNGYLRDEEGHLVHRQIAYEEIYLENPHYYNLEFKEYVVHHINGNKLDNELNNLYICTQEEHEEIHEEQKKLKKKFKSEDEIYDFFDKSKTEFTEKIKKERKKSKEKKHKCLDCGRAINHRGCCLPCNKERKRYREELWKLDEKKRKRYSWWKRIWN